MERQNHRSASTFVSRMSESAERQQDEKHAAQFYRAPQLLVIGRAVDLVQRSSSGHLIDGNGGWYVWGS